MSRFTRTSFLLGMAVFAVAVAVLPEWRTNAVPAAKPAGGRSAAVPLGIVAANPAGENQSPAGPADQHAATLHDWVEREPAAAWRWAAARLPDDDATWQCVLAWIAQEDPWLASGYAAQLAADRPELAQIAHATVLDTLAQDGNYQAAILALDQIPDSEVKNHLVTNLVLQWGRDDPLTAAEWLLGLPGEFDRPAAFAQLGRAWAEDQPQEAAEVLFLLPAGELRRRSLTEALMVWIDKAPVAASAWVAQLEPHADLDLIAARIAREPSLVQTRVDVALSWAESVVDANERVQALGSIVVLWADNDPAAAVRYVQNSPTLTPAQRATLLEDLGSDLASL